MNGPSLQSSSRVNIKPNISSPQNLAACFTEQFEGEGVKKREKGSKKRGGCALLYDRWISE